MRLIAVDVFRGLMSGSCRGDAFAFREEMWRSVWFRSWSGENKESGVGAARAAHGGVVLQHAPEYFGGF